MRRDINYLLKKYPVHKKSNGEIWDTESRKKEQRTHRLKQKYFTFDCLNSHHLRLTGTSKERVKHLIKNVNWKTPFSEEQIIIMIMLYVKLEEGNYIQHHNHLLSKYGLTYENFINFITRIK